MCLLFLDIHVEAFSREDVVRFLERQRILRRVPDLNLLRVRHRHAILAECKADNLYERANLELLGKGMVKHEDCLALGLGDDPL